MRIGVLAALIVAGLLPVRAQKISFAPQWTPQSQFAGFYAAQEKGFYRDEGLDVSFVHVGLSTSGTPSEMLKNDLVQIAGMQTMQSIVERAGGTDIVNVMQITQQTGLCCLSETPIKSFTDLEGKRISRWQSGYSEICDVLANKSAIRLDWIDAVSPIDLFIYKAVDAMLCYSFSELIRYYLVNGDMDEENLIRFADYGDPFPEDGLYVKSEFYRDNRDAVDKFVRASKRGWDWVSNNIEEALDITEAYTSAGHVITNRTMQRMMLENYLELQKNPATGMRDYAPITRDRFDKVMKILHDVGYVDAPVQYEELISVR